ncbi:FkbM family methyltransferase [Candidatus Planktophila dulcis]|uniref:FkbM family methyltransferase n=1 Tax=Candidatus Planktophila dulcis TaxID=1884914 RepID=UPI003CF99233
MSLFTDLTQEVDVRFKSCMEANLRPLLTNKKKKAIFINKSAPLLEEFFYLICAKAKISQFVECGAHDAFASRKIKERYPEIKVVAFEANPHVYENFSNLVNSSGVKFINKALSNRVGIQELILKSKDTKSWSSEGYLGHEDEVDSDLERIGVETTTLDFEMASTLSQSPTALWIDVEGSNRVLIEGAKSLLSSDFVDVILIETQVDLVWKEDFGPIELCEKFSEYGFMPIARDCPQHWGCNILFVREDYMPELLSIKSNYLNQLDSMKLPYFPDIQYRTFLSKIKRRLLNSQSLRIQNSLHRFFSFLGSRSSQDKLHG